MRERWLTLSARADLIPSHDADRRGVTFAYL
jgi:hypothetical protein